MDQGNKSSSSVSSDATNDIKRGENGIFRVGIFSNIN